MLPMSNTTVVPGATETQQLRVIAPIGVATFPLQKRILVNLFLTGTSPFTIKNPIQHWWASGSRPSRFLRIPSRANQRDMILYSNQLIAYISYDFSHLMLMVISSELLACATCIHGANPYRNVSISHGNWDPLSPSSSRRVSSSMHA